MQLEDMILVSVDDHVVEPSDMWEGRVPQKYADLVPKLVPQPDGSDAWEFLGNRSANAGLNAVAGRPPEDYGFDAMAFSEMRPGCYDVHERVRDMSANGVLAQLNFPSWPGFAARQLLRTPDKDLALAMLRGYNDWHVEGWCGEYPDRFIPLGLVPIWDPALIAAEVRRLSRMGCHAVTFAENPVPLGLPSLHSDHWDPFWAACEEEGTIVCMHIGSSGRQVMTAEDAPAGVTHSLTAVSTMSAGADLVFSDIFKKFPTFKFALSEGGIGWVPYLLEKLDTHYAHHRAWTGEDFGGKLPSQVFRERIITCFIEDRVGIENRHDIGVDTITWECDYPHSDSTWPDSPEMLWKQIGHIPDEDIDKITHENAMKAFRFDPYPVRPKEKCTVRALRAEATDVDTGYHYVTKRQSLAATSAALRDQQDRAQESKI
ncbi:amidohydrolase family protein [Pseudonocardia ailaonensis]|uniref:Amidohydrolase family protein n=1 Tax=Pseudonocardia ailaonensis TaxID=367279 RepID=A0ABN2NLF8_9PSEU